MTVYDEPTCVQLWLGTNQADNMGAFFDPLGTVCFIPQQSGFLYVVYVINLSLTKLVVTRGLNIFLAFCMLMNLNYISVYKHANKILANILYSLFDLMSGQ